MLSLPPIETDDEAAPAERSPAEEFGDCLIEGAVIMSALIPVVEAAGDPTPSPDEQAVSGSVRRAFGELAVGHLANLVRLCEAVDVDLKAAGQEFLQRANADLC